MVPLLHILQVSHAQVICYVHANGTAPTLHPFVTRGDTVSYCEVVSGVTNNSLQPETHCATAFPGDGTYGSNFKYMVYFQRLLPCSGQERGYT